MSLLSGSKLALEADEQRPTLERERRLLFYVQTGGQFTEDGSFIGQYVPGKPPVSAQSTPQNPSLQGANAGMATYV